MSNELFAAALGLVDPWCVKDVQFDVEMRTLTVSIDFTKGSRFPHKDAEGLHKIHDTELKRYRHLNFFQHECYLEVRTPRVKLPDGRVVTIIPDWAGKLSGFTLLFEALVMALSERLPFAINAHLCAAKCPSWPWRSWWGRAGTVISLVEIRQAFRRVHAICKRYVDLAVDRLDLSALAMIAFDETSGAALAGRDQVNIAAPRSQLPHLRR